MWSNKKNRLGVKGKLKGKKHLERDGNINDSPQNHFHQPVGAETVMETPILS